MCAGRKQTDEMDQRLSLFSLCAQSQMRMVMETSEFSIFQKTVFISGRDK